MQDPQGVFTPEVISAFKSNSGSFSPLSGVCLCKCGHSNRNPLWTKTTASRPFGGGSLSAVRNELQNNWFLA